MQPDSADGSELQPASRDLQLIRAVLAGRREAADRFAERLAAVPRLLASINAGKGGPLSTHDLEDLAQETLLTIWDKLDQFQGTGTLEIWFYRFCYLKFMNRVRSQSRAARFRDDGESLEVDAGAAPRAWAIEYLDLETGFDRLEPGEAEIVRLKHFAGLTFEEIGRRLAISPNTAKTRYYRGLSELRRVLGARAEEASS